MECFPTDQASFLVQLFVMNSHFGKLQIHLAEGLTCWLKIY